VRWCLLSLSTAQDALALCGLLSGVSGLICTTELLALRSEFQCAGYFDWQVIRLQPLPQLLSWLTSEFDWVMPVLWIRLVACLVLIASVIVGAYILTGLLVLVIGLSIVALMFRLGFGTDGSDQMDFVVASGVGLGLLWPSPHAAVFATIFIAGQSILAYTTSGTSKMFGKRWRSGKALLGILTSRMYGRSGLHHLLQFPGISLALAWAVMLLQISAPAVILLPPQAAVLLVSALFCFHMATAILMGLNTFVFSFASPIPAVIFCNQQLHMLW
jgi:hypothetical protein